MTCVCNTENFQLVILFGKSASNSFKEDQKFFVQKVKPKFSFKRIKKGWLDFTIKVLHVQLLMQTQTPSNLRRLGCGSLICRFFWNIENNKWIYVLLESLALQ